MHLAVGEIQKNNTLLCGSMTRRSLSHNIHELERNTYIYLGAILAVSIVHGGPAPAFFCSAVADFVAFGMSRVKPSFEDIPDMYVRESISKVSF